jgi:hypothetical protein
VASSSRSQVDGSAGSASLLLTWAASSIDVPRRPLLTAPVVTHLVTQRPTLCLQNTPKLSDTVAHLGLSLACIRWNRLESGPAVVSLGGQRWLRLKTSVKTIFPDSIAEAMSLENFPTIIRSHGRTRCLTRNPYGRLCS